MKFSIQSSKALIPFFMIFMLVAFPSVTGIYANSNPITNCPDVTEITLTNETSNSVSFAWAGEAVSYKVKYVKDGVTSTVLVTPTNNITVSGLTAGRYIFYISSICSGETTDYIIMGDIVIN